MYTKQCHLHKERNTFVLNEQSGGGAGLSDDGVTEEDAVHVTCHLGQLLTSTPWRGGQPQEYIQYKTEPKMHNRAPQEAIPACGVLYRQHGGPTEEDSHSSSTFDMLLSVILNVSMHSNVIVTHIVIHLISKTKAEEETHQRKQNLT